MHRGLKSNDLIHKLNQTFETPHFLAEAESQISYMDFADVLIDSALSADGTTLFLCRPAQIDNVPKTKFVIERWDLSSQHGPSLVNSTILDNIDCQGLRWQTGNTQNSALSLIPSPKSSVPPNLYNFVGGGQYLRLGTRILANPLFDDKALTELPEEYWEELDGCDGYLVACRRMQPTKPTTLEDEEKRKTNLKRNIKHLREQHGFGPSPSETASLSRTYDALMDFDDLPVSVVSDETDNFDSELDAEAPYKPSSDNLNLSSQHGSHDANHSNRSDTEEDNPNESSYPLSGFSRSSSVTSKEHLGIGSDFESTASSIFTTESEQRQQTQGFFVSSENLAYEEMKMQYMDTRLVWCDVCDKEAERWLHCLACDDNLFDICFLCVNAGQWCFDKLHKMIEADVNGAITIRSFTGWNVAHEIKVYNMSQNRTHLLDIPCQDERLLHQTRPALHPTAPVVAWPLSPTKILLACFEWDNKHSVLQPMGSFTDKGRKISVDLRFSSCGSYLLVASVEAVEVHECNEQDRKEQSARERKYNLFMQVAVLKIRFENQTLDRAVPVCERHHSLGTSVSRHSYAPYSWTWSAQDICLALTGHAITLYRIQFNLYDVRPPYLGPVEMSAIPVFPQLQDGKWKARVLPVRNQTSPKVLLVPLKSEHGSGSSPPQHAEGASQWSVLGKEDLANTTYIAPSLKRTEKGSEMTLSFNLRPVQLRRGREEIRLLYLLPGSQDDPIRGRLTEVSLPDLEFAKQTLNQHFSVLQNRENEHPQRNREDTEEDTLGNIVATVDYSKPENAHIKFSDLVSQYNTKDVCIFNHRLADQNTIGLAMGIMQQNSEKQRSKTRLRLHPKYNYEALSYVWGESLEGRTITVDDRRQVPVTDNLFAALQRLRWPDRERVLWIDAICIDQENVEERNWQVHLMGRVYSSAASVIVWLGDADIPKPRTNEDVLFRRKLKTHANDGKDRVDNHATLPISENELRNWEVSVLQQVLTTNSPLWWTRVWVVQEFSLAEYVQVASGEVEEHWDLFFDKVCKIWKPSTELHRLVSLRRIRRTWQYKGSIAEAALLTRHCAATNPRDKVYGLLGLIHPAHAALIKPNYALKPAEIFTQATYADLWAHLNVDNTYLESTTENTSETDSRLRDGLPMYPIFGSHGDGTDYTGLRPDRFRILNWAKPTPNRIHGMPSWAVDFSDTDCFTEDTHFRYGRERWTFDGNNNLHKQSRVQLSSDGRKLSVLGVVFDRVVDVISERPMCRYRDDITKWSSRLLTVLSKLPSTNPYNLVTGIARKLRTDNERKVVRNNWIIKRFSLKDWEKIMGTNLVHEVPDWDTRVDKGGGVLSITWKEQVTQVLSHWNPTESAEVGWADLLKESECDGCELEGCRCRPARFFEAWDKCVGVPEHARNFANYDYDRIPSPWHNYCDKFKPPASSDREPSDPLRVEDIGFLLTTSCGFLASGRRSVKPGDVIALFYGSDVPVILRPHYNHYTYKGRAWVNGIMLGELWNVYDDPLLKEQDFEIW